MGFTKALRNTVLYAFRFCVIFYKDFVMLKKTLINYVRPSEIHTELERKAFLFLFILTFTQIVAFQTWQTLYTNFVVEVIALNGAENGIVQAVREIPGLLAVTVIFCLRYVKETSLAVFSVFALGLGVAMTGFFPSFTGILFSTFCMSLGFHYFETINQSLTLQSFNTRVSPLVFGRLRSISALGNILAAVFILLCAAYFSYLQLYLFTGLVAILGAVWALYKKPDLSLLPAQKKNLVFKKKYWLFYALTFLSGGRRQIFTIFSLFLLVEKFDYTVMMVTTLFLINNTVNWFLNPVIGRLINAYGEQKLLTFQYLPAIGIFLGYAYVEVGHIVAFLYILDQFTYSFNIAEKTFFQKVGEKEDIAPSMAVSFTINHISAVTVPVIGGALWLVDYKLPFILGAGLACISLFLVQFINREIAKNAS